MWISWASFAGCFGVWLGRGHAAFQARRSLVPGHHSCHGVATAGAVTGMSWVRNRCLWWYGVHVICDMMALRGKHLVPLIVVPLKERGVVGGCDGASGGHACASTCVLESACAPVCPGVCACVQDAAAARHCHCRALLRGSACIGLVVSGRMLYLGVLEQARGAPPQRPHRPDASGDLKAGWEGGVGVFL